MTPSCASGTQCIAFDLFSGLIGAGADSHPSLCDTYRPILVPVIGLHNACDRL